MNSIRPPLWSDLDSSELLGALARPPDRYRPVPWLAWTGDLDWPGLEQQLRDMLDKGITEFFLFPIYGMEFPYMSARYWQRVGQTLDFCRANGMKCWIYDEYNWPSGVCAGQVLRDHPEFCQQRLLLHVAEAEADLDMPAGVTELQRSGGAAWTIVRHTGVLINVRGCDWLSPVPGYLDVLSPAANRCFIDYTHARYHARFPDAFPATVPGFFTDEPGMHTGAQRDGWLTVPYTDDLFESFLDRYGYDLRGRLADLVAPSATAPRTRCHYWRWAAERFGQAYGEQQRQWCDQHGVALTGHCLAEERLTGHVGTNGDLWELMRHFTIPGIDLLANADGFTFPYRVGFYSVKERRGFHLTTKLVHGIVRHSGGREMLSEAYGVCDWGMNLFRQKCGFNYQVAMGVTLFNDNSLITSIADFRKWAIAGKHFTQPWWRHYRQYADYNARLAALHAEGEPVAHIAVLYPRSTIWARYDATPEDSLKSIEQQLYDMLDELIREQWHFDFIFEPVLADAGIDGDELVTEHARYRALIVPSATDLPRTCLDRLAEFAQAGGILIFTGDVPEREVDTQEHLDDAVQALLAHARTQHIPASGTSVCDALDESLTRALVLFGDGAREFVSSRRRLAGSDVLFVANMADAPTDVELVLNLDGDAIVCDPDTMECYRPETVCAAGDGRQQVRWHFEPWQAYLIMTGDAAARVLDVAAAPAWLAPQQQRLLGGAWEFSARPGNMLRLPTEVRPDPDNQGVVQGWHRDTGNDGWITPADGRELPEPLLPRETPWYWMRSTLQCAAPDGPRRIVCDNPDFLDVYVNGVSAEQVDGEPLWTEENVAFDVSGLFVEGSNTIHVRVRTSKYNDPRVGAFAISAKRLQPVVLVGDFLVSDDGALTPWAGHIRAEQAWEHQGLPHIAGTGTYRRKVTWDGNGRPLLLLPQCTDAVEVLVNGASCGVRTWPPYVFDLNGHLNPGENEMQIRVHNTLGNVITETYGGSRPVEFPVSGLLAPPRLLSV